MMNLEEERHVSPRRKKNRDHPPVSFRLSSRDELADLNERAKRCGKSRSKYIHDKIFCDTLPGCDTPGVSHEPEGDTPSDTLEVVKQGTLDNFRFIFSFFQKHREYLMENMSGTDRAKFKAVRDWLNGL